ncbi:hypothetical protein [Aestuariispira insulae]|uniref:Uncharacterized protein n=1 Tax=Aestuariispira insulae TaxID=1461337 RepID=A0A3D9H6J9_9PROT|nr:hypothetical protein [Aestuariispira insulae]RED45079.1 hypothetical protein DFP90_11272 [Aestuariispira insulae]
MTTGTLQAPICPSCPQGGIKLSAMLPLSWRLREIFWRRRAASGEVHMGHVPTPIEDLADYRSALLSRQPPL